MNLTIKAAAFLAAITIAWAGMPIAALENSHPVSDYLSVVSYTVKKSDSDKLAEKVKKGDQVTVEAVVRQSQLKTKDAGKVSVSASSDSFKITKKDSKIFAETLSQEDEPLSMRIKFTNIKYSGTGDTLKFKLTYSGEHTADYGTVRVAECIEYEAPKKDTSSSDSEKDKDKKTNYGAPVI